MPYPQQRGNILLHLVEYFLTLGLHADRLDVGDAEHPFLRRRQWHNDQIVLVLAAGGLSFRCQYSDHAECGLVDANGLADGVHFPEQVFHDRTAEDRHPIPGIQVPLGDEISFRQLKIPHIQKFRRGSLHRGDPVLAAVNGLILALDHRCDHRDAGYFPGNSLGVLVRHRRGGTGGYPDAGRRRGAGHDDQEIAAQTGNGFLHFFADAHADRDHGDDGADADDDAEHRQNGAHLVGPQAVQSDDYAFPEHRLSSLRSSLTIKPSRKVTVRRV